MSCVWPFSQESCGDHDRDWKSGDRLIVEACVIGGASVTDEISAVRQRWWLPYRIPTSQLRVWAYIAGFNDEVSYLFVIARDCSTIEVNSTRYFAAGLKKASWVYG